MMQAAGASNDQSRTDRPRFRQDLFAEVVEEQGAKFIDVMDPDSGSLYRFYEVEYSLACGMDGERDVPGIVKWAQDELGLSPSDKEVRAVIATLGGLGFIDAGSSVAGAQDELAAGVVAGKPAAHPSIDVALGASGASPLAPPPAPARPAEQVTLGASGASPAERKPSEPTEDISLGTSGAPKRTTRPTPAPKPQASEVSIDLADQFGVGREDVAEAVRQSKIMTAVEVPPELAALVESRQSERPASRPPEPARPMSEPPVAAKAPEPVRPSAELAAVRPEPARPEPGVPRPEPGRPEPRPEPVAAKAPEPVEPVRPGVRPEPVAAKAPEPVAAKAPEPVRPGVRPEPVGKPPVELPKQPIVADKAPVAPPAPQSKVSPVLVVLLILVVLGAAGFVVWKFVLQNGSDTKPGTQDTTGANMPPPVKPAPPTPPPAPPAPTAKVALVAPEPEDIKPPHPGTIETIVAEKPVKADEVIVRITGDRPIEAQLSALGRDEKKLSDQVDLAAKSSAPDLEDKKKLLDAKRAQITAKKTELNGYALPALHDGKFTPAVKNGVKVSQDDVIGKLERDPLPTATFQLDTSQVISATTVTVTASGAAAPITCNIDDKKPTSLKVSCPADSGLADGAELTLQLPGAGSAAPTAPAGTDGAAAAPAAGSAVPAAGAAGAAGSGVPAAGSAATTDGLAAPAVAGSAAK